MGSFRALLTSAFGGLTGFIIFGSATDIIVSDGIPRLNDPSP